MLVLVTVAVGLLHRELGPTGYGHLVQALHGIPANRLGLAGALTVLAYALLTGYDLLAIRYVGSGIGAGRTALASLLAYAVSQTLGFPVVTGGAVRVRYWSMWGMSTSEIAAATAFVAVTFIVGVAAVCGVALLIEPAPLLSLLHLPALLARGVGALLLIAVMAYLAWSTMRRGASLRFRRWTVPVPSGPLAAAQLLLAFLDWTVAGLVCFVLLPVGHGLSPLAFLGVFVLAQSLGLASHVPGGIGIFETLVLLALRGTAPPAALLASLVAYRAIYYLVPFAIGVLVLATLEAFEHRAKVPVLFGTVVSRASAVASVGARVAILLQPLLPTAIGLSTFAGGALLLISGATPAAHGRIGALTAVLPLGLVELSHFTGSMAGVGLLVLGAALRRRLDAAWAASVLLLLTGIVASLLKGLDWEEAAALTIVLLALLASRKAFYRPTSLTADVLSPGWMVALLGVVGASVWIGLLAYRHVEYSHELWWQVAARGNAPRFLRASAGVVAALFGIGWWRLLQPASRMPALPGADELDAAQRVVARVAESTAWLALLGDKHLLFNEERDAFVMYGISGRSWIAMGDPVGETARQAEVAWQFKDLADQKGKWPVFYQVTPALLTLYIDLGLTLLKLGEEATVPLEGFTLDGGRRKWMRRALTEGAQQQLAVEIVPAADVPPLLPELREISDEWLGTRQVREKGFSLGRFDEAYLARGPMAVVRCHPSEGPSRIVAFANLWVGAPGGVVAPDLMRRRRDAPRGVMDVLFIELLLWGAAHGYRAANLGMTPLAGLVDPALVRPELAPLWARAGTFLYGRGETFYNFQGIRNYKQKFDPVWEPRYLASPGGIALPIILANVASLIAGGMGGLVRK